MQSGNNTQTHYKHSDKNDYDSNHAGFTAGFLLFTILLFLAGQIPVSLVDLIQLVAVRFASFFLLRHSNLLVPKG